MKTDYSDLKIKINDYILKNLKEKRRIHTYGVRDTALKLSEIYGADKDKAEIAALFHDMFRGVDVKALNYYVTHLGLDKKYLDNSNLAHGKIAAIIMKRDYNIIDEDIINAVSFHTTGRAGMSKLEKLIYISDAIEPNRTYPGVEEMREMAFKDLDLACLMSLENTINYVTTSGSYLDEDTIHARDDIKKQLERRGEPNDN